MADGRVMTRQFQPLPQQSAQRSVQAPMMQRRPFAPAAETKTEAKPQPSSPPQVQPVAIPLFPPPVQAKLSIGAPGDRYEQEADQVAARVMATPDGAVQRDEMSEEEEKPLQMMPLVQRQAMPEEEEELQMRPAVQREEALEEEEPLQMMPLVQAKGEAPAVPDNFEHQLGQQQGGGQPLDDKTRAFMEPRFGADFGGVRVHETPDLANAIQAQAFTHGQDIYFNSGKYSPGSSGGKELLAHELTHVVQQSESGQGIKSSIQRFAAHIAIGPLALGFLLTAGLTIIVFANKKEIGRVTGATSKGIDPVMEEIHELLTKAGMETVAQAERIRKIISKYFSHRIRIQDFGGDVRQLAIHLARLLRLSEVGGIPPGEPEDPGNNNDKHWWNEIKTFLKNIRNSTRKGTRKQIMRELERKYTKEQIKDIQTRLNEASKRMGEDIPPLLPPS